MYNNDFSEEHERYLKKLTAEKRTVRIGRAGLFIFVLLLWQAAAYFGWIDSFITSSPLRVIKSIAELIKDGSLFRHTMITIGETLCGFLLGLSGGIITAMILWWFPMLSKILDPYLVVLNAIDRKSVV